MRFFLAAIVGCCLFLAVQADRLQDREGYKFVARKRLGHFLELPFTKLYENYATYLVKPFHPERDNDDYRNTQPSGDECVTFFSSFITNDYKIETTEEVVLLDACLGYLFGADPAIHEEDSEKSANVKDNLEVLKGDAKLKAIYDGTQIENLPMDAKLCMNDLLLNSIQVRKGNEAVTCNDQWLELFNKFASCHKAIPQEARSFDTYVSLIYDLVKTRGRQCFDTQIHLLNQAVRGQYKNSFFADRFMNTVKGPLKSLNKQRAERIVPHQLMDVLEAVSKPAEVYTNKLNKLVGRTTKQQVSYRRVAELLQGVVMDPKDRRNEAEIEFAKQWKEGVINTVTQNLADAAISSIDLGIATDPTGSQRYKQWVDKLCNFLRSSDDPSVFDYTTPFAIMVEMIKYPEIYGISQEEFIDKVQNKSRETAPLYLSVYSCNIMTFTQGVFKTHPQNNPKSYKVSMKPNLAGMVVWPTMGFD